jgi:DNA-binding transcriptional ArsR family regulator
MPVVLSGLDPATPPVSAVSPLVEMGSALHVRQDPGHHGRAGWSPPMSAALAARTDRWSWTVQKHRSAPFVTVTGPDESFPDQLARLRAMPAPELAGQLLRPFRQVPRNGPARPPELAGLLGRLADDPAEPVADFLTFLRQTWDEWFAQEWTRVRPALAAQTRDFTQLVAASGPAAAVASLDPALTADGADVTLAEVCHRRHDLAGRGLVVVPSAFTWPHVWVVDVPGEPLLLIHAADRGAGGPGPGEVLARLAAMAHPQRFRVAQTILAEALTAGEVAHLVRADPTVVNRHLRTLARTGLARTMRSGRYVRYRLNGEAVAGLGADTLATLHK